jgi:Protein of unknown function (DUF2948)
MWHGSPGIDTMALLKLAALDADDLGVISAHVQDAVLKVGDLRYLKAGKKFALLAHRFAWEVDGEKERRLSGLHFERVLSVQSHRVSLGDAAGVLSLLSISFTPADEPSGVIALNLSGGGAIKLTVECIEARLADLGPAWDTAHTPGHDK